MARREIQALIDRLGHSNCILCYLTRAVDILLNSQARVSALSTFGAQAMIGCRSLSDYFVSNGPQIGTEDKRCAVDFIISRTVLKRTTTNLHSAPTDRKLGKSLTEDRAEVFRLLDSVLISGVCQLADDPTVPANAKRKRDHRRDPSPHAKQAARRHIARHVQERQTTHTPNGQSGSTEQIYFVDIYD